jgi:hypothetical protein
VIDEREIVRVAVERLAPPEPSYERLQRRRDRKRRNQRIAAGVVGIAVFVAAIWIVTGVASLDGSETPAATGPVGTVPASAAPDVVRQRTCGDGAGVRLELTAYAWVRLELTDIGDRIKVRFEVHRSPVGHRWRITFHLRAKRLSPRSWSHVLPRHQGGKRQRRRRGSAAPSGLGRRLGRWQGV